MMHENYELVQKGFRILLPQLAGYIGRRCHAFIMKAGGKKCWKH